MAQTLVNRATIAQAPAAPARSRMVRGATVMVILTMVANGVNYASNLLFGRLLSPDEFGDLTAIPALSVIASVPTGAAQTLIAERVARNVAKKKFVELSNFMRHALA